VAVLDSDLDQGPLAPRRDLATKTTLGFEGYQPYGKWDVNAYRAGIGSDTTTTPTGQIAPVARGEPVDKRTALRDFTRRENETQSHIAKQIGPDAWFSLPEGTQAALTSLAYNYGSLDRLPSVLAAARSGSPERVAQAIAARAGDNQGVNANRRMQEAQLALRPDAPNAPAPAKAEGGMGFSLAKIGLSPAAAQPPKTEEPKPAEGKPAGASTTGFSLQALGLAPAAPPAQGAKPGETKPTEGEKDTLWERLMGLATRGLPPEEAKTVREMIERSPTMQLAGMAAEVPALVTRAAGLLPNEYGGKQAVEATKALESVGPTESHVIGRVVAPLAVGGPLGGAMRAGAGLAGRALGFGAEAAEEAIPAAEAATTAAQKLPLGKAMLKHGIQIGEGGALYGLTQGGGTEEDYEKRLKDKAFEGVFGGVGGAALGAGGTVLWRGGAKALEAAGVLRSGSEEAAARKVAGGVTEKLDEAIKSRQADIAKADYWRDEGIKFSREQQDKLNRYAALREMLEERRTGVGGGTVPKEFSARREMVENMRALRAEAEAKGWTPEELNSRVVAEERRVTLAELAAERLAKEDLARSTASPQEVGGPLQEAASNIYEAGVAARVTEAGIPEVLEAAGREPRYTAHGVLDYVDEELPHINNPATRSALERFRRDAMGERLEGEAEEIPQMLPGETPSAAAARRAEAEAARGAAEQEPGKMSLDRLYSLRKDVSSALATKRMQLANGNQLSITPETAHHLGKMLERVDAEIEAQAPELAEANARFAELSRPLDEFRTSMHDVIATDLFSRDFKMGEAEVVNKLLARAKSGAEPIVRLVQERPELREDLRRLFNYKLRDFAEDVGRYGRILKENENALRQSGLWDEFSGIVQQKIAAQRAMAQARAGYEAAERVHGERLGKEEQRGVFGLKSAQENIKAQEAIKAKSEKDIEAYKQAQANINSYLREANPEPEKAMREAGRFVDRMHSDKMIDDGQHKEFLEMIRDAEHQYQIKKDAKGLLTRVGNIVLVTMAASQLSRWGITHLRSLQIIR
jgi:GH24 family phage-related lysozyme (muramidase)